MATEGGGATAIVPLLLLLPSAEATAGLLVWGGDDGDDQGVLGWSELLWEL